MRPTVLAVLLALSLPSVAMAQVSSAHIGAVPAFVPNAVNDPARQADKSEDARRKITDVMKFTGVKPSDFKIQKPVGSQAPPGADPALVGPWSNP